MIVVQERLSIIFDALPEIDGHKVHFDSGTKTYLNRLLTGYFKEGKAPYPLIWMLEGDEDEDESEGCVKKRAEFILCTRNESLNMYNPQRLATSFANVLIPLYDNMLMGIKKSDIANYKDDSIKRRFVYNYSINENENVVVDIWDAIKVTLDLRIYGINKC